MHDFMLAYLPAQSGVHIHALFRSQARKQADRQLRPGRQAGMQAGGQSGRLIDDQQASMQAYWQARQSKQYISNHRNEQASKLARQQNRQASKRLNEQGSKPERKQASMQARRDIRPVCGQARKHA